jgi:hypothetical protein
LQVSTRIHVLELQLAAIDNYFALSAALNTQVVFFFLLLPSKQHL